MAGLICGGCGSRRTTDTPRTASEQLLVSASIDQSVGQLDFQPLEGRKVFIDDKLVDRVDKTFLLATVRMNAWQAGVLVMDELAQADVVVELRSGAVGVDRDEYLLGIPSTTLPTPVGTAPIPEAAVFKSLKQVGASRVSFVAYERESRQFLYACGPVYGFSNQKSWWICGGGPSPKGDIQPKRTAENTGTVVTPE